MAEHQAEDPNSIFAAVVETYHASLLPSERKELRKFPSKEAMLQSLTDLCWTHKETSRLGRCSAKIAKFSNAFAPYFDIINIFVQVKPEYMGIVWGSLRLLFQLGANHVTFLEKLTDLFETLSLSLPRYQQHYESCMRRQFVSMDKARVVKLMTFVYEDVVNFCSEVYKIFRPRPQENDFKRAMRMIRHTVWRPFDSRFESLQDRMRRHQELFDREMRVFDQQILIQHFEEFQQYVKDGEECEEQERAKVQAAQKKLADARIGDLKRWICNTEYKDTFEQALRRRHPESCSWMLANSRYVEWRDNAFERAESDQVTENKTSWNSRLLSLHAKPGFGKTILSSAIIEDLMGHAQTARTGNTGFDSLAVAFFHFDQTTRMGGRISAEAFRALAAQLIHIHRNAEAVMDALYILFDEQAGGQRQASANEVEAVLKILLQQWPAFLVIDGVDECSDSTDFLRNLWAILNESDCKILLLSRPNLEFPHSYQTHSGLTDSWQIHLNRSQNTEAIRSCLRYDLNVLTSLSLFSRNIDDGLVAELAQRSNGMFLWAKLLVNYLECPALTRRERMVVLEDANLLEGLETLYNTILNTLERCYARQKQVAADLFKWMTFSLYPMGSEELHVALAIVPGEPTLDHHLLGNWPRCIRQITCALVDIDPQGQVNFIHLSLKEFLERSPFCNWTFSLRNKRPIHERIAKRCLSYLKYDIPERPLRRLDRSISLETGITSCGVEACLEERLTPVENRAVLLKKYPFLQYAAFCWATHLARTLSLPDISWHAPSSREHDRHLKRNHSSALSEWPEYQIEFSRTKRLRHETDTRLDSTLDSTCDEKLPWDPEHNDGGMASTFQNSSSQVYREQGGRSQPRQSEQAMEIDWTSILAEFLLRRHSVTAWVESCWTFNFPPNLSRLDGLLQDLCTRHSIKDLEGREMWWISTGVHQLSDALKELPRETLLHNPTLIWQKHFTMATDQEYWPNWELEPDERNVDENESLIVRAGFLSRGDAPCVGLASALIEQT